ncbi:hypothetical protein ElyMa_005002800 [Elysia marginata]|uniref:Uncharacterized protein n=1 Tax=Elysia marginata TaxID=1093978 RepID=A0AAV4J636_9GAST|nr:hypothetical protein ElyMa_005002800 [Elysia marginata]
MARGKIPGRVLLVCLMMAGAVGAKGMSAAEPDNDCEGRDVLECLSEKSISFQFPQPSVVPSNPSLPPVNPSLPPASPFPPNPFPPPNPSFPNPFPPPNPSFPNPFPPPNPSFPNPFPPPNPSSPNPFPPPNPSAPNPFPPNPSFPLNPSFPPNSLPPPNPSAGVPIPSAPIILQQAAREPEATVAVTGTEAPEETVNNNSTSNNSSSENIDYPKPTEEVKAVPSRLRRESSPQEAKPMLKRDKSIKKAPWWHKRSVGQR